MANAMGDQERRSEDAARLELQREHAQGQVYGPSLAPGDHRSWTGLPPQEDFGDHDGWNPGPDAYDVLHGANAGLGPDGWRRADARLRETICEQLLADRILDARGVEVRVEQGVVTLAGEVRHPSDVRLAEILTREVAPGAELRNRLRGPDGR